MYVFEVWDKFLYTAPRNSLQGVVVSKQEHWADGLDKSFYLLNADLAERRIERKAHVNEELWQQRMSQLSPFLWKKKQKKKKKLHPVMTHATDHYNTGQDLMASLTQSGVGTP